MAENNNLIPTEPDWDGTPMSRSEEILYSIIHTEEWDGTPMSRGEYFLVQLKDAIENISMMDIKGTVPTVADLPSTGNKKGDVYSVGPEEQLNKPEYYWDGEAWQYLGQIVDLSGYLPLTGGTMTGELNFNIGGKKLRIGVTNGETVIVGVDNTPLRIVGSNGISITLTGGSLELGDDHYPAFTHNTDGHASTEIWGGSSTSVKSDISTTIKGHRSNNADTNTITLDSNGITETTAAKKVVTTATGIELGTTSADNTVSVSTPSKKLSVSSPVQMDVNSGGNLNATGYGNVNVTATAGSITEIANGNVTNRANSGSTSIYGKQGVDLTAGINQSTIGYVTATHGVSPPVSDSSNKVATTAIAHAIANSKIGTVPFGTCSSAADAVAKTVTVTNFPGLVDGATITVLFENTNTATNPTLNVNGSGAQPIMRTTANAVGTTQGSSWATGGVSVSLTYVQNVGWVMRDYTYFSFVNQFNNESNNDYRVLLSSEAVDRTTVASTNKSGNLTFNPSTKRLVVTNGNIYTDNTTMDRDGPLPSSDVANNVIGVRDKDGELVGVLSTLIDTEGSVSMQMASYAETANGSVVTNSLRIISKKDGSTAFDINGVPVYISTTQPTGNIPIGAIGLGW